MFLGRRIAGTVALVCYLVMGAMLYFTVLPGANGLWPPDFHLRGYDDQSIREFWFLTGGPLCATYCDLLRLWDPIFIISFALWIALVGWRGGRLRYVVTSLAFLYALTDLAENRVLSMIFSFDFLNPNFVEAASHLTMAKFASLYLCVLVLIVHLRRTV